MVKVYYRLVKGGKLDIEDVPEKYREQVRILLEGDENA